MNSKMILNRIWKKLLLVTILGMVFTLLSTYMVQWQVTKQQVEADLQGELEVLITVAVKAFEQPLWNLNQELVKGLGDAYFQDEKVGSLRVFDEGIGPVYERISGLEEHQDQYLLYATKPVIVRDQQIGTVEIGITRYFADQELQGTLWSQIIQMILLGVVLSVILAISIQQITRPFKTIKAGIETVGRSETKGDIIVETNDELEELANQFNKMRHRIEDDNRKIQSMNHNLEQIVTERTRELNRKNQELETSFEEVHEVKDQLEVKNTELEHVVSELRGAQEQLVQSAKMALLGELVAGVAHEINTPIGVSLTMSTFMENEIDDLIKDVESGKITKRKLMSDLETFSDSTSSMTRNLIRAGDLIASFKQVAVDQSSHQSRTFYFKEYMDEILRNLHGKYKKRPITFDIQIPDDLVIESYPGAYSQIFTNLTMNALIHAYDLEDEGTITISANASDDRLNIWFSDDGCGILSEEITKVFEPFFTTKRDSGGSGLGLSIVFNTVEQVLRGKVTVSSIEGEGTTFYINVPLVHPDIEVEKEQLINP